MENNVQVKEVMMLPDGRLDTKNAASYTGLSEKTLAMMRCEGNGPKYIKLGRVFYFRNDLDEWILSGRTSSTAQVVKGQ